MKRNTLGSSETTREASSTQAFQAYIPYIPQHRRFDQSFLEWFIGFAEGDGNFQAWYQNETETLRFRFCLTQADRALLSNIRTELGYGTIAPITANDGMVYYQLRLESRQSVLAVLHLFEGNIRLVKVQKIFHEWADKVCDRFNIEKPYNPSGLASKPINLRDAWLSGFFQANGGFAAQFRTDTRYFVGYQIEIKAYLDQKGDLLRLEEIADLLGCTVNCQNLDRDCYRVRISSHESLDVFLGYLNRFPLRGKKHIAQSRWARVLNYLRTYELPEPGTKSYVRFVRLVQHVHACQKKVPTLIKTKVFGSTENRTKMENNNKN